MKVKAFLLGVLALAGVFVGFDLQNSHGTSFAAKKAANYDESVTLPMAKYPETGKHIKDAIAAGHSAVCTIDRGGAADRRKESLKGYPTKPGYDRDEFPMAMCKEGGKGADIRYITPADNRGAGSYIGNHVENYPDGTKVLISVK
ncbi:NucB [Fictibacillus macauensis ZFHKF-1]|uniref:NucB n=1 Tax=Fictibacillus macauensis ZFHKF-1 TaxID=1196324 RepID=I8AKQ0_9BACL|nr:NucA/NucB deoxyribonuclease domain-containing protein [Fictibacillus macauensis]EIT86417.1 NucB [Fictibacillus macauensis ZFHKF-1]